MNIRFLGATETVTGSRYLVTVGDTRLLVDCGLFQGYKHLRLKNRDLFPVPATEIDAVLLTHAHLDHSGYIPLLVKNGFRGPIHCTAATRDLCRILLPDSGYLQEEEARFANKRGFSKHSPALPLYTREDAEHSLDSLVPVPWCKPFAITAGPHSARSAHPPIEVEFHPAGHLLGAASILIRHRGRSIIFSGDLGRTNDPLMPAPVFTQGADALVIESTYGDRLHPVQDSMEEVRQIINRTAERGGVVLIPSFAVGRAQALLHFIHELKQRNAIPDLPVFLNSPMAVHANQIFCRHAAESKLSEADAHAACATAHAVSSVEESKELNEKRGPMIVIAASGMATGGRVLHHLKAFAPDPKNTILFVGFQAGGTRGDAITRGAQEVKIHGEYWPIRAEVVRLDSMSAHADRNGLLDWISSLKQRPTQIFVTHGEPAAADSLRRAIDERFGSRAIVPEFGRSFEL